MTQEDLDPYQFYNKMPDEYLEDALKRKLFEAQSYRKWHERTEEEIHYIRNVQSIRKLESTENKNVS